MFTTEMLTITKIWNQSKCPFTDDEWIKKIWYIHTMEYYLAIKNNKIMPFSATWVDLEVVILSEIIKTEKYKQTSHDIAYVTLLI